MSSQSFDNSHMRKELDDYEDLLSNAYNSKLGENNASCDRSNNRSKIGKCVPSQKPMRLEVSQHLEVSTLINAANAEMHEFKSFDNEYKNEEEAYLRELSAFERQRSPHKNSDARNVTGREENRMLVSRVQLQSQIANNNLLEADKSTFTMKWDISAIPLFNSQVNKLAYLLVSVGVNNPEIIETRRIKRQESEVINTDIYAVKDEKHEQVEKLQKQQEEDLKKARRAHKAKFYVVVDTIKLLIPSKTAKNKSMRTTSSFTKSRNMKTNQNIVNSNSKSRNVKENSRTGISKTNHNRRPSDNLTADNDASFGQSKLANQSESLIKSQFAQYDDSRIQKSFKFDGLQTGTLKPLKKHSVNAQLDSLLIRTQRTFTISKAIMAQAEGRSPLLAHNELSEKQLLSKMNTEVSNNGMKLKPSGKNVQAVSVRNVKLENTLCLNSSVITNAKTPLSNVKQSHFKKQKQSVSPIKRPTSVSKSFTHKSIKHASPDKFTREQPKSKTPELTRPKKTMSVSIPHDFDTIRSKYETALSDLEAFNYKMAKKLESVISENQKLRSMLDSKSANDGMSISAKSTKKNAQGNGKYSSTRGN